MTVKYLDSKRISGITADRTGTPEVPAVSGGWKEVGRTTLGSSADTISVASLPDKKYYMILGHIKNTGGNTVSHVRVNSSTADYSLRRSVNNATDQTETSTNRLFSTHNSKSIDSRFIQGYLANKSDIEKLGLFNVVENPSTGASGQPAKIEGVGKHAQTSSALNEVRLYNDEAGSFATGGELVVLGWDESDTHTTNFWEELASVELSSSNTTIDTGTITAKKYLMYQIFAKKSTSGDVRFRFNSDTGSNYTQRNGINGTDYSYGSLDKMNICGDPAQTTDNFFGTGFIINNSSDEKLLTGYGLWRNTAGAGNVPKRAELANKWANTSSQITSIQAINTTFDTGSILKVWGSD